MNISKRRILSSFIALFSAGMTIPQASAGEFPEKHIKMVIPYSTGGPGDIIARSFASELDKAIGTSIIAENKPGGGTIIGTKYAANAKNDGYTILQVTSSQYINRLLYGPEISYDLTELFDPVSYNFETPMVLVTPSSKKIKTLEDLIKFSKDNKISYGSGSIGTIGHLTSELLKKRLKIDALNIPYTSNGSAMVDLLSGRLDFYFAMPIDVYARVKSGDLNALAITSPARDPNLPQVSTMRDLGYAELESVVSWGFMIPKGTPAKVIEKYSASVSKAVGNKAFVEKMQKMGVTVSDGSPAVLAQKIKSENSKWSSIIKEQNIRIN